MDLILPDRFAGELYQRTTTRNPPAESRDRATSSHSQIPKCASTLENRNRSETASITAPPTEVLQDHLHAEKKDSLPSI